MKYNSCVFYCWRKAASFLSKLHYNPSRQRKVWYMVTVIECYAKIDFILCWDKKKVAWLLLNPYCIIIGCSSFLVISFLSHFSCLCLLVAGEINHCREHLSTQVTPDSCRQSQLDLASLLSLLLFLYVSTSFLFEKVLNRQSIGLEQKFATFA